MEQPQHFFLMNLQLVLSTSIIFKATHLHYRFTKSSTLAQLVKLASRQQGSVYKFNTGNNTQFSVITFLARVHPKTTTDRSTLLETEPNASSPTSRWPLHPPTPPSPPCAQPTTPCKPRTRPPLVLEARPSSAPCRSELPFRRRCVLAHLVILIFPVIHCWQS